MAKKKVLLEELKLLKQKADKISFMVDEDSPGPSGISTGGNTEWMIYSVSGAAL